MFGPDINNSVFSLSSYSTFAAPTATRQTQQQQLTCVRVLGIHHSDRRADSGVVEHGDLIVAGREAGRVVVHVLDHQQDVGLTGSTPAIRRLRHQVELHVPLTVQHGQREELTWDRCTTHNHQTTEHKHPQNKATLVMHMQMMTYVL